nr:putative reverse transcriptase domain-containing protein [Tanacetum cinerariifolium]
MAAPAIPVFAEENLRDPIDIKMDIIHPEPIAAVAFPATAVVRTQAQHREAIRGIQEKLLGVPIQEELTALRFRRKQEHEEHLKLILELLKKEQLYAKFSKCKFWITKVQFLSHAIDSQSIYVDPTNIESIKDWMSPKNYNGDS